DMCGLAPRRGSSCMTWGKRDDQAWQNEKLIGLSHAAYRLRDVALSFAASEWPTGAGCLSRHRLVALARLHHIENDSLVILELLNLRVLDRCRRDKRGGERFRLHDFAMYMSPVDLSAVRAAAGKRGAI